MLLPSGVDRSPAHVPLISVAAKVACAATVANRTAHTEKRRKMRFIVFSLQGRISGEMIHNHQSNSLTQSHPAPSASPPKASAPQPSGFRADDPPTKFPESAAYSVSDAAATPAPLASALRLA